MPHGRLVLPLHIISILTLALPSSNSHIPPFWSRRQQAGNSPLLALVHHPLPVPPLPRPLQPHPQQVLQDPVLQPPLPRGRLHEPQRPLRALGVPRRCAVALSLPERRPQLVPRHVPSRRRELHRLQQPPVEVSVGVHNVRFGAHGFVVVQVVLLIPPPPRI
ncbi:hypothetical protein TOPH_01185 [Tolypocladium ophioglossoides CBS 100239]|uniref:Uncharacterized protein n=1 Tax=Tolypocladium ophioglossoides (strain CBS 100239) TaxID=1163406 RepID=A0A0L0NJV2_TOLOC|nr:hypothetical protein TOPH_01185 [Tolypocladium ophioglossoides CBS 100239]